MINQTAPNRPLAGTTIPDTQVNQDLASWPHTKETQRVYVRLTLELLLSHARPEP